MEFSIIACAQDGTQLTGSGYKSVDSVVRHVQDRVDSHLRGSTLLDCIVIVGQYGRTLHLKVRGNKNVELNLKRFLTGVGVDLRTTFPEVDP